MPRASAVSTIVAKQRRIVHAAGRPHPRVHRDRGEAGHGVDLVDHRAVVGEEEVDAGQALAVDRVERPDRQLPHRIGDVVVDLGGHVEFGGVVEILGREVVERVLAAPHPRDPDLADRAGFDPAVGEFENATL